RFFLFRSGSTAFRPINFSGLTQSTPKIRVQPKRKSRTNQRRRGSIAIISRLLDVGDYFPGIAGCARWVEAIPTTDSLRDERARGHARPEILDTDENRR